MKGLFYTIVLSIAIVKVTAAQQAQKKKIDSLMHEAYRRGVFNGTMIVAQNDRIIYDKAWGYADGTKTRPLTTAMKFDIGSISKEFNGVSIMLLQESGKLKLDDPVSKFLTGLPAWADEVHIRNLLNYTSGLPNFTAQSNETDAQLLDSIKSLRALKFRPGAAYIYAHANVYLQKRIIESASGLSYAGFVDKYIFKPCGMTQSVMDADLGRPDVAKAFDNEFKPTPYIQVTTGFPRLTTGDLYRFISRLEAFKLISKASFLELAQNFPGGESSLGTTGLKDGSLIWHRHQGSNSNYEGLVYTDKVQHVTIILETNNQAFKVDAIRNAILHILNGEPFEVPKRSVYLDIRDKIFANIDRGLSFYQKIRSQEQERYDFRAEAADLISTGKYLQRRSRFDDAIRIYALAIPLCTRPADTSYAYELTGECFLKKGDKLAAKTWYMKALVADPNNKNAQGMIDSLN